MSLLDRKIYRTRTAVAWATVILMIGCFLLYLPHPAYASAIDTIGDFLNPDTYPDSIAGIIEDLTNGEFIKDTLDAFFSSSVIEDIMDSVTGQKLSFMKGFTTALKAIAMLIIIFNMISTLVKELERGSMSMESWFKVLLAFVLPCVLIIEYNQIIKALSAIGVWMYDGLKTSIRIETVSSTPVKGTSFTGGWAVGASIVAFIKGIFVGFGFLLLNFFIVIIIMTGVLSNYVEIVLRQIFMPLAIANICHEGARSAGMRYIKQYLGCYMKIACIMVSVTAVFWVYSKIQAIPGLSWTERMLYFILLVPATKQALRMSNEIITSAIGANN